MDRLKSWGFSTGQIHGGNGDQGSRDQPGTRIYTEQQFREGNIQVLVATEAAGEGINLQFCNILFNYDIPWNPEPLGTAHGADSSLRPTVFNCLIFNFVAKNTIEGSSAQQTPRKAT